jgi:hypothetical protein
MRLPDPNGTYARRPESLGLRAAVLVCRTAGIVATAYGLLLSLGCALTVVGLLRATGTADDTLVVEGILGGGAVLFLLIGLPLLFGRGRRLLRTILPAVIGGIFAIVVVQTPVLGLVLGTNGAEMVIVFVLGIVYLSVLVTEPVAVTTSPARPSES